MLDIPEIRPASVAQVRKSLSGQMVLVDDDVQNVVRDIHAIDASLHVCFDPYQDIWLVTQTVTRGDGEEVENFVTSARELDQRLVTRIREITSPRYDLAAELERVEAQADADAEHRRRELTGEAGEKLAHALRKDLGLTTGKAFFPSKE